MGGIFKDMLSNDETLFKNELALDFSFQPKVVPYRENEQRFVAACVKPLFSQNNGKNVFIHGKPGIGKTIAVKHLMDELEEETDEIVPIYVNCWQRNTTYKIVLEICDLLDFKFVQNKKTEELFRWIKQNLNKKSVVFIFDEVDKLEDTDFIYMILEEIYRKSVIVITNYKDWISNLDDRIKSRMLPEIVEFKPYKPEEVKGILKQRMKYAFHAGVFEDDAFELIAKKTFEVEDIRKGLHLMRESGMIAEGKSLRKINLECAKAALEKINEFSAKDDNELATDERMILNIVKDNSGKRIGDLFKVYQEKGGNLVYKSFQRKINTLSKGNFVKVEKTAGGADGNTTIVKASGQETLEGF